MRTALIEKGVVVNIAVGKPAGYVDCPNEVSVGWVYKNGKFTAPIEAPTPLDYRQQRIAAYPSVGDQLDVIWKELGAQKAKGVQLPETKEMLTNINDIKRRYLKKDGR